MLVQMRMFAAPDAGEHFCERMARSPSSLPCSLSHSLQELNLDAGPGVREVHQRGGMGEGGASERGQGRRRCIRKGGTVAGTQKMQQSLAPLTALTQPNVFANMLQMVRGVACAAKHARPAELLRVQPLQHQQLHSAKWPRPYACLLC